MSTKKRKLVVEVNSKFKKADDTMIKPDGGVVMFTPPLGEDFWIYRVKLRHGQAIIGFPKFGQIGCGFSKETDWNTNLPINCKAEEIFNHIKHNKRFSDISRAECLEAIRAIQKVVGVTSEKELKI